MTKAIILFDMDGVLIDVSNSYRLAIKKTAEYFTNTEVNFKEINSYKKITGYNNDWDLTQAIILKRGKKVPKQEIINKFQEYYLGKNFNGLIKNEKWLANNKLIKELSKKYSLGIVTGRPRVEAKYALKTNNATKYFPIIIAMEDVEKDKPNPQGILKALKLLNSKKGVYLGDTINDKKAAKRAKIEFELIKDNINFVMKKYLGERLR